ncbi:MAG: phosphatase PAP2 family protein [Chloroflexi bacterium]|nr:phosphatase PAP2 family protein [Chloroflexota bacterium]
MEPILNFGIDLIVAFQGLGDWLAGPMSAITFLGSEYFFLFFLPVLYWSVDAALGIRVAFILLVSGAVNDAFKLALHGPRPYWFSADVAAHAAETSFGVPSGHAQIATGVWGMVAATLKKGWAWLAAALVILLIGLSRLYLGVHFPHDVLLGWLIGGIVLWLTLVLWKPVTAWVRKLNLGKQALLAFGFSLLLLLVNLPGYLSLEAGFTTPVEWVENAALAFPDEEPINPVSLEGVLTNAGTLFGLAAGLALLARKGGFDAGGAWWKRALRFLLGVAGVLALYLGLKMVFPEGDNWLAYSLRYVRYALIGFWVAAGAPLVFYALKLAQRPE